MVHLILPQFVVQPGPSCPRRLFCPICDSARRCPAGILPLQVLSEAEAAAPGTLQASQGLERIITLDVLLLSLLGFILKSFTSVISSLTWTVTQPRFVENSLYTTCYILSHDSTLSSRSLSQRQIDCKTKKVKLQSPHLHGPFQAPTPNFVYSFS